MFIRSAAIKNFRLFGDTFEIIENELNVPDGDNHGSGLTVFAGENSTGKSAMLEALAFTLLNYKAEGIGVKDFNKINEDIEIVLNSDRPFSVKRTVPRGTFNATGFKFKANLRKQGNRKYLSSPVVSDTQFIQADDENIDESSPDLRTAVNNPFSGPRFNDNEYVYIDRNSTKILESGSFNSTRFDRILGDFNFQYLKANSESILSPNSASIEILNSSAVNNSYLDKAFEQFEKLTGYKAGLSLIDDTEPYTNAFLTYKDGNQDQLLVERLGSGYHKFLSILCYYYLSLQSEKNLIILIDEAELHLHYNLQVKLAKLLLHISKDAQIIITTHSAQLLRDLRNNEHHIVNVLERDSNKTIISQIDQYVLPSASANEAGYLAFGLPNMEYFNELYGYLQDLFNKSTVTDFDREIADGEQIHSWIRDDGGTDRLTIHSCLRNKIHHPSNTENDDYIDFDTQLPISIEFLRLKIKEFHS